MPWSMTNRGWNTWTDPHPFRYPGVSGRKQVLASHTSDFFVLRTDSAGWEEWKPEERLLELARPQRNPVGKRGN
jgi:hypothetical protein